MKLSRKSIIPQDLDLLFKDIINEKQEFNSLIDKYGISASTLLPIARWTEKEYTRICIDSNETFELILICWNKNQKTEIHGHKGQKCWVNFMMGSFTESIFSVNEQAKPRETFTRTTGESSYIDDSLGFHSLENTSKNLGMSLHLYKTIEKTTEPLEYHFDYTSQSDDNEEIIKEMDQFVALSTSLLKDEEENPISRRIPVENLSNELNFELSKEGISDSEYYEIVEDIVLATPKTSSKLFFNQLFGGRKSKAVLGDLLAVMLNNSMYTYKVAGVQVGIEKEIISQVQQKIGYGSKSGGTFPTGGSMSNFMAILMARDKADEQSQFTGIHSNLVAYTSEECHYSIEKNAAFIGLGRENVQKIESDSFGKMNAEKLKERIIEDKSNGKVPFFINGTAGTTVLGAFDPFEELAAISEEFNCWFHIDGAYSGAAIFSEKYKHLVKGVSRSDSFSFNPHKMLGTPMTCSIIMVNDQKHLYSSFSNSAKYLYQTDHDDYNLGKTSFQCGRRNDSLKLWTLWKSVGTEGLEKIVDQQFELANTARNYINSNSDYTVYSFDDSVSICFNYKSIPADKLCTSLYEKDDLMVGYGTFNENQFIRLVTVNSTNSNQDILHFFKVLESHVEKYF